MGLFSRAKPKIKIQTTKRDGFSGWLKCTHCNELIHSAELEKNMNCCPKCNYHYRLAVNDRILSLVDSDSFKELFTSIRPKDPLNFADEELYKNRLEAAQEKSGNPEAVVTGTC